jgi:fructokinase
MDATTNLWGIDLGGTKIEGVILRSPDNPEPLFRERVPTGADRGYEFIQNQVKTLLGHMETAAGYRPQRIGIGTPGVRVPRTGLMKNCNTTCLNGRPLKADLEQLLGLSIEMANDANCFALAETRLGVVRQRYPDARVVFGIILGTGVGGGVVVNGQVLHGFHGIGGEWGHNYLSEAEGYPCYCGKTGCNESILSGPALERFYHERTGVKKSLAEIVAAAGNDPAAGQTLERLTHYFGLAVSVVVNILDPDVIVVGGGVGNIDRIYTDGVAEIDRYIFNDRFEGRVVRPSLGDSAGVFGAAFLTENANSPIPC